MIYQMNRHKKNYMTIAAAWLLTACTAESTAEQASQSAQAVTFGAYVATPVTRSGEEINRHSLDEDELKKPNSGFGVFAYYTDDATFEEAGEGQIQDFMYNQHVTWDSNINAWTYAPKKYWPNEKGTQSSGTDYLSFFAYAPYDANVTIDNAKDPYIKYELADSPADVTDLMWATAPANSEKAGLPHLNLTKPDVKDTVELHFKHALARLELMVVADYGNLNVRPDLAGNTRELEKADTLKALENTRITVESVKLTAKDAYKKARLNLNNTVAGRPLWTLVDGAENQADKSYAITSTMIAPSIADPGSGYASMFEEGSTVTGVPRLKPGYEASPSKCATDIINAAIQERYYYFIPKERPEQTFVLEVVYWTTVKDASLIKGDTPGYSRIKHTTSQTLKLNGRNGNPLFEGNKHFKVTLRLGLEGIQFSVASVAWNGNETITNTP